ncbi:MAG: gas vesicle protein [Nanoarchaeota archaeon]|nr:gas vesicle protein [Nanoarchaeota archaeon]
MIPEKTESGNGLADAIDKILDKGLVINADIIVNVSGTELLGIKIRAALASFETAARYGLQFPSGTKETQALLEAEKNKEKCPQCDKLTETKVLLEEMCPWCGWISAKAKEKKKQGEEIKVKIMGKNQMAKKKEKKWEEDEEEEIEVEV